jgi:hypothetical protein
MRQGSCVCADCMPVYADGFAQRLKNPPLLPGPCTQGQQVALDPRDAALLQVGICVRVTRLAAASFTVQPTHSCGAPVAMSMRDAALLCTLRPRSVRRAKSGCRGKGRRQQSPSGLLERLWRWVGCCMRLPPNRWWTYERVLKASSACTITTTGPGMR